MINLNLLFVFRFGGANVGVAMSGKTDPIHMQIVKLKISDAINEVCASSNRIPKFSHFR